jgi:hypothetical protein
LWIICHTDSSILAAWLGLAVGSISAFAAGSDLLFVSLHPIELGLLVLLLLFYSIVLKILASTVGVEQVDPHLAAGASLLILRARSLVLRLPLLTCVACRRS